MNPRFNSLLSLAGIFGLSQSSRLHSGVSPLLVHPLDYDYIPSRPALELAFRPVFRTARDQRREVKAYRNANPWKGSPL